MASLTFYAPNFIDESLTHRQEPTGRLSGMLFTRTFSIRGSKLQAKRGIVSFSWDEDTQDAKAAALAKAIDGMEELPELDSNPPLIWVPSFIEERLTDIVEARGSVTGRQHEASPQTSKAMRSTLSA